MVRKAKKLKGLMCLLCVFMLLVTSLVPAIADSKSLAFDMESLGITAGMDAGTRQDEYVRRDEFAQMVVNMMLQQDVAKTLENEAYFTDIADSKYKGAINLLAKMNYISGSGNGVYNPSEYITYGAACKILVHALGYDVITEDKSLYGYQYTAGNIKLTDGIDSSKQYLSFGQAMRMIDNALDIGLMAPMYYNANIAPSYEIDADRTYRSYLNGRNGNGIVKMRGVITADVTTYLYEPVKNLKADQLQISGKTYKFNRTAPTGFVGQEVEFYITQENYEEGYITAIIPTNKNAVCDFTGKHIEKVSSDLIEFRTDSGEKYKVEFDYTTRFIVNNRFVDNYNIKDLEVNDNIVVRTVDNDEDEIVDVVFVFEYVDCIVESVSVATKTISFEDGFLYKSNKSLKLDEEKLNWEIFDAKGNIISYEDLKAGDVLSIATSANGEAVRIIKGAGTIEGIIASVDGKYILIDNTEYVLGKALLNEDIDLGVKVIGYLNFLGVLVDYEEEKADNNYAYVYSYSETSGLGGNYKVKLLLPEYISIKKVEGAVDELSGEVATSNSLFVRNSDVVIYSTEDKIVFNGVKKKAGIVLAEVLDKPVSYYINSNGKISKIDTLDAVDDVEIKSSANSTECVTLSKKKYNGTEQLFGGSKGSPFGIGKDRTLAFCVPLYSEQPKSSVSDDDLKVYVELSNGLEYESNGYEIDETDLVVDVLVIQRVMNSDGSIPVLDTSDVGLVLSVSDVLSDDKSTELKAVTMLTEGKQMKFVVANTRVDQPEIKKLEKNDLIMYTLDGFDQINSVTILQKNDEYHESFVDVYSYGEVKNVMHNQISNTRVRRINKVDLGYTNSDVIENTAELLTRNPAPVFIIEGKEARIGELNDIQIGDMVYMSLYNITEVRAIVIKR